MSTEPSTTAKAVLHTTKGPIEIELWAKEIPLASRNFLQLCLDGYYNGTIFHRVVPNFVVQGGDKSGTGNESKSIYDDLFKYESHSRIKYAHRGMVGCANANKDRNGSQFIITLAAAPELDGKNTCFGRVIGGSIYNVLKVAQGEIEQDERPLYPVKVTKAEVLVPYFDDLVYDRENKPGKQKAAPKKKKVAISVDREDEDEEDEEMPILKPKKKPVKKVEKKEPEKVTTPAGSQAPAKPKEPSKLPKEPVKEESKDSLEDELASLKASIKGKAIDPEEQEEASKKLSILEQEQQGYKRPNPRNSKEQKAKRDADVVAMLKKFQSKLDAKASQAPKTAMDLPDDEDNDHEPEFNSDDELPSDYEEKVEYDEDWMGHRFTYEADKVVNEDTLVTIDPLEQKRKQDEIYKQHDPRGLFKKRKQ